MKAEAAAMVYVAYGLTPPAALLGTNGETPVNDGSWTKDEVKRLLCDFQFIHGTFGNARIISYKICVAQL